ncbi:MAG: VgrG-related protein [Anaerolineaceae bacterium]|nr:VgrG-related protein [Anaerolineaceae bacterium]
MSNNISVKFGFFKDKEISADIAEVIVDTNVFMPGMFTIIIDDEVDDYLFGGLKHTDNKSTFSVGESVEISMEKDSFYNLFPVKNTLMKGEITSVEPIFKPDGRIQLRIRGYDRSHRLTYGKKTRTYGDANPTGSGIGEDKIIQTIVSETSGITSKSVDTSGLSNMKYTYVMQYNQSDWDFLWTRAQMLGYQVWVDDKKLHFEKADAKRYSKKPDTLIWGRNLSKFEPRMVASGAVTEAMAVGWDPESQKQVTSTVSRDSSDTNPDSGLGVSGAKSIKKAFGSDAADVVIDPNLQDSGKAKTMAGALFAKAQSQFVKASGELRDGDPYLLAGTIAEIEGVGTRFSGDYYVTEAKHIWRRGDYNVRFTVSGRNPYTIRHLLLGDEPHLNKINGVVPAKVTSLDDPEKLGRLQVSYPWLPKYKNSDLGSNWARLAIQGGGKERGIYFSPEIDDEVLVAFEHGDMNFPYIVGVLWNKKNKPLEGTGPVLANGVVEQRVLRSGSGHLIVLNDKKGEEQIIIVDKTGKNSITMNSKDNSMEIKAAGDLTIEAGGKLNIKSTSDFTVDSKGKGAISAATSLEMKGTSSANLKGGASEVDLQAASAALKGTKVDVQANASASVKGNAMVEIQGGIVKIN